MFHIMRYVDIRDFTGIWRRRQGLPSCRELRKITGGLSEIKGINRGPCNLRLISGKTKGKNGVGLLSLGRKRDKG
jgi:hypothetical protein